MLLRDALFDRFSTQNISEACALLMDCAAGAQRGQNDRHLQNLVKLLGIRVLRAKNVPFEGRYSWDSTGECITIGEHVNHNRLRFTVAHELGHCVLRRFLIQDTRIGERFRGSHISSGNRSEEESLANALAAEILMPLRTVRDTLKSYTVGWNAVSALTTAVSVSRTAAIRRIAEVSKCTLAYASLIPRYADDLEARAVVDDFMLVRPGIGIYRERDGISLEKRHVFARVAAANRITSGFMTGEFNVRGEFQVARTARPLAVARLLGAVTVLAADNRSVN